MWLGQVSAHYVVTALVTAPPHSHSILKLVRLVPPSTCTFAEILLHAEIQVSFTKG